MKFHPINDVETLHATSLQSRVKHIFIKIPLHPVSTENPGA